MILHERPCCRNFERRREVLQEVNRWKIVQSKMKVICNEMNEMNEILPIICGISSYVTALVFNAEPLNVAAASNHCVNLLQWTKSANVVSLRISFQQRSFCKAENPLWWLQVPRRYFLNNELR